jgi:hypothetical protein
MGSLSDGRPEHSRALAVGTNLAADAVAADVVREFGRRGIRTLVLRGPGITRWLYRDGDRDYVDTDLLVEPDLLDHAEATLRELGFRGRSLRTSTHAQPRHAESWVRGATPAVDLHRTIVGVEAADQDAWRILWTRSEPIVLHGVEAQTLDRIGLLVVLTLHAAQHGWESATRDLEVALTRVGIEDWRQALALGSQLQALPVFGTGLRLSPAGRGVADQLGLEVSPSPETLLRSEAPPDLALGLNWVIELPTARARLGFAVSKVFPSRAAMRASSDLARRGGFGLAAAYASRFVWLSIRAPRAILAVRRARRKVRRRSTT